MTKFQKLVILPHVDPYKHGVIRVSNLESFKASYNKYADSYNKYSKARPHLQAQMDSMMGVVTRLKKGDGYYQGRWMSDKGIDTAIALEAQAEINKRRKDALAYLEEMELLNGKAYKEVLVKKKLHDKILFNHKDGAASAKYDQLPSALRKELGVFDVERVVKLSSTEEKICQGLKG